MTISAEPNLEVRDHGLRAPDFFIVGHSKCGTTALHRMLSQHPNVFMPVKETRFFSPELRSRSRWIAPSNAPETLEDYLSLFARASPEQRTGEATPEYLRSHAAAARIAAVAPDARIIAILREPASFLRSFHLQCTHNHIETQKDFRKAMALEDARRAGRRIPLLSQSPPTLLYSDHVRYVEQLRRFHDVFSRERVLVLVYEDFRRDNRAVVREVLRFLELDDTQTITAVESNPLPSVRFEVLHQAARLISTVRRNRSNLPVVRALNSLIPSQQSNGRLKAGWRRLVYSAQAPPDEQLMRQLRYRFTDEVKALSEYLDRDLVSLWGYDKLQ